jgi:hypothetical protein
VNPRLIQTYLLDGTLEGARIIELSESSIKAFMVPRLKLADVKDRTELTHPAFYLLVSSDSTDTYIGESENFFDRVKNHDQSKDFWDVAIAFVSETNKWEKSDVKYLESRIIELARTAGTRNIINKTNPVRNNVHEFKLFSLGVAARDIAFIASSLGYDLLSSEKSTTQTWHATAKKTNAKAVFSGEKFVVLAGSIIDKTAATSWIKDWPKPYAERSELFRRYGEDQGDVVTLKENVPFRSPNHAGGFVAGRSINAWLLWRDSTGRTMDEVMRKGEK